MDNAADYMVRLRVRLGKALNTTEPVINFIVGSRTVEVTSQNQGRALSDSEWIILVSSGFSSHEEAAKFGENLKSWLELSSVATFLGVDTGEGNVTSGLTEDWARQTGLLQEGQRLANNIHGLMVLPNDKNVRFSSLSANISDPPDPAFLI